MEPISFSLELTIHRNWIQKSVNTTEDATRNEGFVQLTHIIIDCSSFPYIDIMGIEALARAHAEYNAINITVFFACCKGEFLFALAYFSLIRCKYHSIKDDLNPICHSFPNT